MKEYLGQRSNISVHVIVLEEVILSNIKKKSIQKKKKELLTYQGVKKFKHNLTMEHEDNVVGITEESLYQSPNNYNKRPIESYLDWEALVLLSWKV